MPTYKFHTLLDYSLEPNGSGVIPALCYAKDEKVALQIAQHPVYTKTFGSGTGVKNDVVEREVPFFENLDQFLEWRGELVTETEFASAMAKLTPAEIDALKKRGLVTLAGN